MTEHLTNGMIDHCHQGRVHSNAKYLITAGLLGWSLVPFPTLAYSGNLGGDTVSCAVDRPCFSGSYQAGNKVIFNFNGIRDWDVYNVRYATGGWGKASREQVRIVYL